MWWVKTPTTVAESYHLYMIQAYGFLFYLLFFINGLKSVVTIWSEPMALHLNAKPIKVTAMVAIPTRRPIIIRIIPVASATFNLAIVTILITIGTIPIAIETIFVAIGTILMAIGTIFIAIVLILMTIVTNLMAIVTIFMAIVTIFMAI